MSTDFLPGDLVTINGKGDLRMCRDEAFFIDKDCVIVKKNKNGLYRVALVSDDKKFDNFSKYNITLVKRFQIETTF